MPPPPDNHRGAILLVDDRQQNLLALQAVLEPLGHPLVTATSGEDALKRVLEQDFAVILLDVQMPGMDGFETARLIKRRQQSTHTPIIFLTALSQQHEYTFEGYAAGAVDYLTKPYNPEILRAKVKVFLDLDAKTREIERQAEQLREAERREAELRHQTVLMETETRSAAEVHELNQVLEQRQRDLQDREERLARILETTADALVFVDAAGKVVFANPAAEVLLGRSATELQGKSYVEAWPLMSLDGRQLPEDLRPVAHVLRTGYAVAAVEHALVRADGSRRILRINAAPLRDATGALAGVVASFSDVTDLWRAESRQRFMAEASRRLAESLEFKTTLRNLAGLAVPELADWCGIYLRGPSGAPRLARAQHRDGGLAPAPWALDRSHPAPVLRVLETGGAEIFDPAAEDLSGGEIGLRSALAVPLHARGAVQGVLLLAVAGERPGYTLDDQAAAEDLASRAALALDNSQLYRAATRAPDRTARLYSLAARLSETVTAAELARVLVEEPAQALHADSAALVSWNAAAGALRLMASTGESAPELAEDRMPLQSALPLTEAIRTGEPVWVESRAELLARFPEAAQRAEGGDGAWVAIPVFMQGAPSAALGFRFPVAREFSSEVREFLGTVAEQGSQALERARLFEAEREANRAKSDFLASMSHELRTPLNAILGYTCLMLDGIPAPVPEPVLASLSRVEVAAKHLLQLIEEILTFARMETGREAPRPEQIDVRQLVRDAASYVEPLARSRGLSFEVATPDEPVAIETDVRKARQILVNVLDNAVKFTHSGEVHLAVRSEDGEIVFVVRDTGVGIAPEHRERVFEPFWQVHQSKTREVGGTGLGLSVARGLAQLLGGGISVESSPGQGSIFTIRLPKRLRPPEVPSAIAA